MSPRRAASVGWNAETARIRQRSHGHGHGHGLSPSGENSVRGRGKHSARSTRTT